MIDQCNGVVCPFCESRATRHWAWTDSHRKDYMCQNCHKEFQKVDTTIIPNTTKREIAIFHKTYASCGYCGGMDYCNWDEEKEMYLCDDCK